MVLAGLLWSQLCKICGIGWWSFSHLKLGAPWSPASRRDNGRHRSLTGHLCSLPVSWNLSHSPVFGECSLLEEGHSQLYHRSESHCRTTLQIQRMLGKRGYTGDCRQHFTCIFILTKLRHSQVHEPEITWLVNSRVKIQAWEVEVRRPPWALPPKAVMLSAPGAGSDPTFNEQHQFCAFLHCHR